MLDKTSLDTDALAKKIGGVLTAVWKESNMTKVDLAKRANMGRVSVTKILQGEQLPQLPALYTLCAILEIELTDLLPSIQDVMTQTDPQIVLPEGAKAQLPDNIVKEIEGRS